MAAPTTIVLIPGAGSNGWYWHLVEADLRRLGHDTVAVDLPCDEESAGLSAYTDAVVAAIGDRAGRGRLVVVAQSLGGFTVPLVCERVPVDLLVLVAAMIPAPGETGIDWWTTTGREEAVRGNPYGDDLEAHFVHDVPADLAAEALRQGRNQASTPMREPWPFAAWPDVPTRFLLCRRDRFFPADWLRGVVADRLGLVADEIDSGHLPALARPHELAERLETYRQEIA